MHLVFTLLLSHASTICYCKNNHYMVKPFHVLFVHRHNKYLRPNSHIKMNIVYEIVASFESWFSRIINQNICVTLMYFTGITIMAHIYDTNTYHIQTLNKSLYTKIDILNEIYKIRTCKALDIGEQTFSTLQFCNPSECDDIPRL